MKPTLGLSLVQILLLAMFWAHLWPQSISAISLKATPLVATQITAAPTRSGPVALFGLVGLGMIVAAISVRIVCLTPPPEDASAASSRTLRTTGRRTGSNTSHKLELRSPLSQKFVPFS